MTDKNKAIEALRQIVQSIGEPQPGIGDAIESYALHKYSEFCGDDTVERWAASFKFQRFDRKGDLIYSREENGECYIVKLCHTGGDYSLHLYKVMHGVEREPVLHEKLTCHVECMIVRFFVKAHRVYGNLQSIAATLDRIAKGGA